VAHGLPVMTGAQKWTLFALVAPLAFVVGIFAFVPRRPAECTESEAVCRIKRKDAWIDRKVQASIDTCMAKQNTYRQCTDEWPLSKRHQFYLNIYERSAPEIY
jgi:hypothetical protein